MHLIRAFLYAIDHLNTIMMMTTTFVLSSPPLGKKENVKEMAFSSQENGGHSTLSKVYSRRQNFFHAVGSVNSSYNNNDVLNY